MNLLRHGILKIATAAVLVSVLQTAAAGSTIDRLVDARLNELGIPPSERCTDAVFLRRVYLDMLGTLPTAEEARAFLDDRSGTKRAELIEQLFERPEFADYRALRWCDLLRVKAEFPSKLWPNAVQAYYRWIHTALQDNMPYDDFARALLTSSGSNFRVAPVNFYRAMPERDPETIARVTALTFMGMRAENWDADRLRGMAAFFGQVSYKGTAEWKEEIVFSDPTRQYLHPDTGEPVQPVFPDGTPATFTPERDMRMVFAEWLVADRSFADNVVNRTWYWLLGRGIIHEPDDIRADNPPSNPALLNYLSRELVESGYDLQHIYRLILNSETYQRSAIHSEQNLSDTSNFSHGYVRRLDAEVLIDAICRITGTTESYSSDIPEPFTFIPENERSVRLADGSITSPFLDLFGRPPRDTGFLAERNNVPSAAQKLHLLNSSHIQKKIVNNSELLGMYSTDAKGRKKPQAAWRPAEEVIENIYLTILSRYPEPEEIETALAYAKNSGLGRPEATADLIWALLNTKEFIFKH